MLSRQIVSLLMPWRSSSSFVIGYSVDPTLSCGSLYLPVNCCEDWQ